MSGASGKTIHSVGAAFAALKLGCDKWVCAHATPAGQKQGFRTVSARKRAALDEEFAEAKARFGCKCAPCSPSIE